MADDDEKMTLKSFIGSFSKSSNLEKVSASLFNFLDHKSVGYVTFEDLLHKLYPQLTKKEFKTVL